MTISIYVEKKYKEYCWICQYHNLFYSLIVVFSGEGGFVWDYFLAGRSDILESLVVNWQNSLKSQDSRKSVCPAKK